MESIKKYILDFSEKNLFTFYFASKIAVSIWRCFYVIPRIGKKHKLADFNLNEITGRKKSDTFFILGGGASINQLTQDQWLKIEQGDSLGINFWFVHPHKPNFMLIEGFRSTDIGSPRYDFFYKSIQALSRKYSDVVFFIKDIDLLNFDFSRFPDNIRSNARAIPKISIPGSHNTSVRRSIGIIRLLKFSIFKKTPVSSRASISFAISLGKLLGYKNIVLCGVDLDNNKYFWEDINFICASETGIPESTGQKTAGIHSTVDPNVNQLLIDEVIYDMQDLLLSDAGVKLYVSSKSSKLHPRVPCYWDEKNREP